MMLPKEQREERAIERFLEYYNGTKGTSYRLTRWIDRDRTIQTVGKQPDCICKDQTTGAEMVVEYTMLTGPEDFGLSKGAEEFLTKVKSRLAYKLPGVFLLYNWDKIRYRTKTKEALIIQLCQEIERIAPTLAEGEEAQLYQPFPVKLRKEAWEATGNCDLIPVPCEVFVVDPKDPKIREQFEKVLNEADEKFVNWTHMPTIFLVYIGETGLDYKKFEEYVFQGVDMGENPNVRHIYLSHPYVSPELRVYHLWSRSG